MYRILIVDNEDYVVEGLIEVFHQLPHLELEVIGAFSAKEALEWLKRTKVDIVISDIRMPGMDGMTLHREIVRYWPRCQVIFLSGFNDFGYAQRAIRGGALDYVLKTDGDEVLITAVEKAVRKLEAEIEINALIAKSKNQIETAGAALQKDFFSNMLQGDQIGQSALSRQFKELSIPLHPIVPALLVIGRVDEWAADIVYYDRCLLLYSIQNIAGEYLDTTVVQVSFVYDRFNLIWLIQPKEMNPSSIPRIQEETWAMIERFVQGTFERIQEACRELLKLKLSVALADRPAGWGELSPKFASMRSELAWGLGSGQEMLIVNKENAAGESPPFSQLHNSVYQLNRLTECLNHNLPESFNDILTEILSQGSFEQNYYMAASLILSIQPQGLNLLSSGEQVDGDRLLRPDLFASRSEAIDYLRECGNLLFDCKNRLLHEQEDELVFRVKRIIGDNLGNELSLTAIAENVNHNPSYLSRLFKQKNGVGIAEYITDCRIQRAKDMLGDPNRKIQDIAAAVGFSSVQYFYRVFKKAARFTPQEYREKLLHEHERK
ncbi:response regulator [Paenibacillus nasutitermitis]|uniref:DNA-binding response regulator n=1 Tax=Paenibacillus nasutitermitis TaxID=1652958 RepID=A0A917DY19_9BACL|nr:response regulator [Paenibacillus nasutitermitis]GGD82409.1 hypothetical protein GCM10010911_45670 [Paenibacillus nasutitermitis]